jgi:hypothetical protein
MKAHILNGIPYSVSESGDVYMYQSEIIVGRLTSDKKGIIFLDNWKDKISDYLNIYRRSLSIQTIAKMEQAKVQYKGNLK